MTAPPIFGVLARRTLESRWKPLPDPMSKPPPAPMSAAPPWPISSPASSSFRLSEAIDSRSPASCDTNRCRTPASDTGTPIDSQYLGLRRGVRHQLLRQAPIEMPSCLALLKAMPDQLRLGLAKRQILVDRHRMFKMIGAQHHVQADLPQILLKLGRLRAIKFWDLVQRTTVEMDDDRRLTEFRLRSQVGDEAPIGGRTKLF